jgi:hypothetical protein
VYMYRTIAKLTRHNRIQATSKRLASHFGLTGRLRNLRAD